MQLPALSLQTQLKKGEKLFPLDFLVTSFAWETGPPLKRSQTLSLTSTDRKQSEAKSSPFHDEAWLWCLTQYAEGRTKFLRDDKPPSPTAIWCISLYAATWLSNLCCLLPSPFHCGASRITCWTAEQLQKEKQEVRKDNLVWGGCYPGNRDGHRLIFMANWPTAPRLSIHPKLRHQALLTHFLETQDMKKISGSTPLENIVKNSAAHLLHKFLVCSKPK